MFVKLKDWDLRKGPGLSAKDVAGKAMRAFGGYRGAIVFAFPPPAVTELGVATGFDLMRPGPGRPRPRGAHEAR